MTLGQLVNPQFQAALKLLVAQEIPIRSAFKLKGVLKRLDEELRKYDELRAETLKRLGAKKEDGELNIDESGTVKLEPDNLKLFVDEMNALLLTQVDIGSLSVMELGDKLSLTTSDLLLLEGLVVD